MFENIVKRKKIEWNKVKDNDVGKSNNLESKEKF